MRALVFLSVVASLATTAASAGADGEASLLPIFGALLVPNELGTDIALTGARRIPRLRLGWSDQIPMTFKLDPKEPRYYHRIVLAVRLAFGDQPLPGTEEELTTTFDVRLGYRYRFPHGAHLVAPYFGLGHTWEVWPERVGEVAPSHVSVSPELGLHVGTDGPGGFVSVQADAYFVVEPRVRAMALVGWTLW